MNLKEKDFSFFDDNSSGNSDLSLNFEEEDIFIDNHNPEIEEDNFSLRSIKEKNSNTFTPFKRCLNNKLSKNESNLKLGLNLKKTFFYCENDSKKNENICSDLSKTNEIQIVRDFQIIYQFFKDFLQYILKKNIPTFLNTKEELIKNADFLKNYNQYPIFLKIFLDKINSFKLRIMNCKKNCFVCEFEHKSCKICLKTLKEINMKKKKVRQKNRNKLHNKEKCLECKKCIFDYSTPKKITSTNPLRSIYEIIFGKLKNNIPKPEKLKNFMSFKIFSFLKKYFNFEEEDFFEDVKQGEFINLKKFKENFKKFLMKEKFLVRIKKIIEFSSTKILEVFSDTISILKQLLIKNKDFEEVLFKKIKTNDKRKEKFDKFFKGLKKLFLYSLEKKIIRDIPQEQAHYQKFTERSGSIKKRKKTFFYIIGDLDKFLAWKKYNVSNIFKNDFLKKKQIFYFINNDKYFSDFKEEFESFEKQFFENFYRDLLKILLKIKNLDSILGKDFEEFFGNWIFCVFGIQKMKKLIEKVEKERKLYNQYFAEFI